jgi:hypothetical protein
MVGFGSFPIFFIMLSLFFFNSMIDKSLREKKKDLRREKKNE